MTVERELGNTGKKTTTLVLTALGGFVDAVGYIALYQVFTANMSGNSVHVGMYLGQADLINLIRPVCAIGAYAVGVISTRIVMEIGARASFRPIATCTLAAEALLLVVFARATPAMHLGQIVDMQSPGYFALVAILAFAMGVQTATLTHIGPLTVYTTFVTGTLTKASESFARFLFWLWDRLRAAHPSTSGLLGSAVQQRDAQDALFLSGVWCCYVAGAALGTAAKGRWELRALYLPVGVLMVFVMLDFFRPMGVEEVQHQRDSSPG